MQPMDNLPIGNLMNTYGYIFGRTLLISYATLGGVTGFDSDRMR